MIQVRAFRGLINRYFPVDFRIPGWRVIDLDDADQDRADAYFQVNVKKPKTSTLPEYDFILHSGRPYLVMESNIFRKNSFPPDIPSKAYYRLGWFHFLRQGNFNNQDCPSDRWRILQDTQNLEVRPWKNQDGYVLLALQKPGDSTLNSLYENFDTYQDWIAYAIDLIRKFTDSDIVIRPHYTVTKIDVNKFVAPRVKISTRWQDRTIYEGGDGLQQDLDGARAVVSYNSNCLVESTLAGVPSFPLSDESVVWDISNRIQDLNRPKLDIDRNQWLYNAAYMVWTLDEINQGAAWNHLRPVFFPDA